MKTDLSEERSDDCEKRSGILEALDEFEELIQKEVKRGYALWKNIESTSTLGDVLGALTKAELDQIRRVYNFKGISSLNKPKLAHELTQLIPAHLERMLYTMDQERYGFLKKIVRNGGAVPAAKPLEIDKLATLMNCGLAYPMRGGSRCVLSNDCLTIVL
ncbi:hypothetical protein SAMN05428981_107118 [Bacillus sp. OV194]|nr:hypothetical protein SAMN05428981_107118 [Bacillus sp. OV194]